MPQTPLGITNPYTSTGTLDDKVSARIGTRDHAYIKSKFPYLHAASDKILSTLYRNLVLSLQEYELTNGPFDPAWYVDDPTFDLLRAGLQRQPLRLLTGSTLPRDERGGTQPVHQADGDHASVGSYSKEGSESGGEGEDAGQAEEQPGAGPTGLDALLNLLKPR